jgi:general secretion pathway protein N
MARTATPVNARTPLAWALGGAALGLLLATVMFAPAAWLAGRVHSASGGQVMLQDARGTVWNGSAQLTLTGGPGSSDSSTLPGRLAWRVQPLWGELHASVLADCCMQTPLALDVLPRWGGVHLRMQDQRSQWPALLLTGLGTPWNTIRAEGQLALSSQGFGLEWIHGRLALQGQLQVDAIDVASRLSTLRPMGSYRFVVDGGDTPRLSLSTTQGALQLSGSGQWTDGRLRFVGEASAAPERLDALANLLNIIGRREGARSIIQVG